MTDFVTATVGAPTLDPWKRVLYSYGLVLGVDEFMQEQTYHVEHHRLHNRVLHGYGTIWGLAVEGPRPGDADPEIRVAAGLAVDPCGREIPVKQVMCVKLRPWLQRWEEWLRPRFGGSPPFPIPLAVVLCYRACETDEAPIPGEPCRSRDDAIRPTRIKDTFTLRLALREDVETSPPADAPEGLDTYVIRQPEEDAVRAFGALLRRLRLAESGETPDDPATLLDAVRALLDTNESSPPLGSPPLGSPPLGSPPDVALLLDPASADDEIRAMFRVWVTEVRPALLRAEAGDMCEPQDCCVLLAEVDLDVTTGWEVGPNTVINETRRPILLHTRLLQEMMFGHSGGGTVVVQPGVTDHGALAGLGDDDHPQYIKRTEIAGGDVTGTFDALTVDGLQSRPVAPAAPSANDVLTWDGTEWTPQPLPPAPVQPPPPLPNDIVFAPNVAPNNPQSPVKRVAIVAAATVAVEGSTVKIEPLSYGNVKGTMAGNLLTLTFDTYQPPGDQNRLNYVVLLTSFGKVTFLLTVVDFRPNGFRVLARNPNDTGAEAFQFMVQVTEYNF